MRRSSGLRELRDIVTDVRHPHAWAIFAPAMVPLAALIVDIGPASSPVLCAATSVIEVCVYIFIFCFWRGERCRRLRDKMVFALAVLGMSLILFVYGADTAMIYEPVWSKHSFTGLNTGAPLLPMMLILTWLTIWGSLCAVIGSFVLAERRRKRRYGKRTYYRLLGNGF